MSRSSARSTLGTNDPDTASYLRGEFLVKVIAVLLSASNRVAVVVTQTLAWIHCETWRYLVWDTGRIGTGLLVSTVRDSWIH